MATVVEEALRRQLEERRGRLAAFAGTGPHRHDASLESLLQQVDEALARMDAGRYGICEACHEPVEADRLLADPLCRFCLDHLTPAERSSLEHDLELAGRIQEALLPGRDVSLDGWEIHTHYEPAGPVSGDYWDLLRDGTAGEALFLFGDVAGKGVSASIQMAGLQAIFRSLAAAGLSLPELLVRANRLFCEATPASSYATLVCGRLGRSGAVQLVNAGHCPPLLLRGGGVESLTAANLPLGLFCETPYTAQAVDVRPGEALVLYTDGLSEARARSGEEYGVERIRATLDRGRGLPARELVRALRRDLEAFQGGAPRGDDLTVTALRRVPDAPA